jgi:DNA-binding response OmpR family regulator
VKILVVEDEVDLNSIITRHLKKQGYSVDSAFDGEEALDFIKVGSYDIIIADIMMPKMDGYTLIKELRDKGISTPVLILTAKDEINDKVMGLDLGADDFVVKPFEFDELLARIRALLRRQYGSSDNILQIDDLFINISEKSVTRGGKHIELTGKEYELLEYLIHNKGKTVTRVQLQEHVWDYDYEGYSNVIDVLIKNIRKKIDLGNSKQIIFTKRGLGYVVREDGK